MPTNLQCIQSTDMNDCSVDRDNAKAVGGSARSIRDHRRNMAKNRQTSFNVGY